MPEWGMLFVVEVTRKRQSRYLKKIRIFQIRNFCNSVAEFFFQKMWYTRKKILTIFPPLFARAFLYEKKKLILNDSKMCENVWLVERVGASIKLKIRCEWKLIEIAQKSEAVWSFVLTNNGKNV